jgi:mannose-6-phosphate isomerase class I
VILLCRPLSVERIWGSLRSPSGATVGEIWWLYDGPAHSTTLVDLSRGCEAGTVSSALTGGLLPGDRCPLIFKTLHTADVLSIQVHPGAFGGDLCKSETWIFIRTDAPSMVLAGLAEGVSRKSLELSLESGNFDGILRPWDVSPGDSLHLPPGTVHALGAGNEVLEIQINCDVTYRLSDWGRLGADGSSRRLDVAEGLSCVDFRAIPTLTRAGVPEALDSVAGYGIRKLCSCEVDLPGGGIVFSVEGGLGVSGRFIDSPCCVVASTEGGAVLVEGLGYAATALEGKWRARSGA